MMIFVFNVENCSSVEGGKAMIPIKNTTTGNFCLAYACNTEDHDIGQWEVQVL